MMKIEEEQQKEHCEELVLRLPKVKNWAGTFHYLYKGVWCEPKHFESLLSYDKHFLAHDSDTIVATMPKSGTTWLKALTFSITTRTLHFPSLLINSPLLSSNPHTLVPFLEFGPPGKKPRFLQHLPSPRLYGTHLPCKLLPTSINDSKCRVIYLCRNPLDQFISHYHFYNKFTTFLETGTAPTVDLSEAFDAFCQGKQFMGPMWDHVLGYWKMSVKRPEKVLFLRYEDLNKDTLGCTKKIADFLGCPFSAEEEARGVIKDVVKLCSFHTLRELEVNKNGEMGPGAKNEYFFRKGEVGDWANYLTPEMVKRAQEIMEDKFGDSGLTFNFDFNYI